MTQKEINLSDSKHIKFNFDKFLDESRIIEEEKQVNLILDKIKLSLEKSQKKFINLKLIYSAIEDGDSAEDFHKKCDGHAPIIIFIKTKKNVTFGGYTEVPFYATKKKKGNKDDNAFLFSIDKMKIYEVEKGATATCSLKNYGPVFNGYEHSNIYLFDDFFHDKGNVATKGDRFKTTEDYEINNGEQYFYVKELEIYQVLFINN